MQSPCPSDDTLSAFACGETNKRGRLVAHLDVCAACRLVVSNAARSSEPVLARGSHPEHVVEIEADEPSTNDIARASSSSGPRIGRYVIRELIGQGAMGIVHLAYDPELKRHVAVKLMRPDAVDDGVGGHRLLIEAQAAAQLAHPNTVTVFDVGVDNGQPYVAMELVEGSTLAEWLRESQPDWRAGLEVMCLAGEGLAAAHRAGLVHRDFKLGNVLLDKEQPSRIVKVSDFGLARFSEASLSMIATHEEALSLPRSPRAQTTAGVFVGTPAYTAPELYAGSPATEASDQFAFGVALYRVLYGLRPFRGPTLYSIFTAICHSPAPRPPAGSGVPDALWPIVARALAKDPADRHPSMTDLLDALRDAAGARGATNERCPFPGLVAFGEEDARLYFGRSRELAEITGRLRDHAMAAVIGPSGSGKSSFVRALVVPALRAAEPTCEVIYVRPGARPLLALARAIAPHADGELLAEPDELAEWFARDPRHVAAMLLAIARRRRTTVHLFVDQLEELYTQAAALEERQAFASAIAAVAEDATRPLRVIASLRSDFLERVSECGSLMSRISDGFLYMSPPGRVGLIEALTKPLAAVGYELEDVAIAAEISARLEAQPGAFPLLQFIAGQLWEARDLSTRTITRASVDAIGSLATALSAHADRLLAQLTASEQHLARAVLVRMVTPERTRAQITPGELADVGGDAAAIERIVEHLVRGRLIVANGTIVELAHESLITTWPTLRGWLDDAAGDSKLIAEIGAAAKRWDAAGRPEGYLWSGEPARRAIELARRRARITLAETERAFVAATDRVLRRGTRRRRLAVITALVTSAAIAVATSVGLVIVQQARADAEASAVIARAETERAQHATDQLETVDADLQSERVKRAEIARRQRDEAVAAKEEIVRVNDQLAAANAELAGKNGALRSALGKASTARDALAATQGDLLRQIESNQVLLRERTALIQQLKSDNARLRGRLPE